MKPRQMPGKSDCDVCLSEVSWFARKLCNVLVKMAKRKKEEKLFVYACYDVRIRQSINPFYIEVVAF